MDDTKKNPHAPDDIPPDEWKAWAKSPCTKAVLWWLKATLASRKEKVSALRHRAGEELLTYQFEPIRREAIEASAAADVLWQAVDGIEHNLRKAGAI